MVKDICDIQIHPPELCTYRFIPLWGLKRKDVLLDNGVLHCGLGEVGGEYEVARRDPDFHHVMFTRGGRGTLRSPFRHCTAGKGDLVAMAAHVPHHYTILRAPWKTFWFHLDPARWPEPTARGPVSRKARFAEELEGLVACYYAETLREAPQSQDLLWHLGEAILNYLRRELSGTTSTHNDRIQHDLAILVRDIDTNLSHRWTLNEMASRFHMSPRTFLYHAKKHLGSTPMGLVTRLRMQRACSMLVATGGKISAMAEDLGYSDQFAFSTAFKRYHGLSPREYRKNYVVKQDAAK